MIITLCVSAVPVVIASCRKGIHVRNGCISSLFEPLARRQLKRIETGRGYSIGPGLYRLGSAHILYARRRGVLKRSAAHALRVDMGLFGKSKRKDPKKVVSSKTFTIKRKEKSLNASPVIVLVPLNARLFRTMRICNIFIIAIYRPPCKLKN